MITAPHELRTRLLEDWVDGAVASYVKTNRDMREYGIGTESGLNAKIEKKLAEIGAEIKKQRCLLDRGILQ